MKKRIWICSLLACALLLPLLSLPGAAQDAQQAPGSVLYAEDYEGALTPESLGWSTDDKYPGESYSLSIVEGLGESGSWGLRILEEQDAWCGIEIVPAGAMEGVRQYVLTLQVSWTRATRLTFRMNSPEGGTGGAGNWTGINWTTNIEHTDFNAQGVSGGDKTTPVTRVEDSNTLTIAVDLEAKTIDVFLNGELVNSRPTEYDQPSAIWMIVRNCDAVIDDLRVTEGTVADAGTGRVLYAEDFEGYPTERNYHLLPSAQYPSYPSAFSTRTVEDSTRLVYTHTSGSSDSWTGCEVVPASALEGVRRYTVQFDMRIEQTNNWSGGVNLRFGSTADDTSGNWLRFVHSNDFQNSAMLYGDGRKGEKDSVKYPQGTITGATHRFAIEVDADARTVRVYMDGEVLLQGADTSDTVGGVWLVCQYHTTVSFDNFLVTAGTLADCPVRYAGTQLSAVTDGRYSVRWIGVLQDNLALEAYHEVGFLVSASWQGGSKCFDTACSYVYGTLTGTDENGISEEYQASDLGGSYLLALSVNGIPVSAGEVTFVVQPYFVTDAGRAVGAAYEAVYRDGELLRQTVRH